MIEHLKSGLSISTHVGCPMRCDYCVLSVMDEFRKGPMEHQSPDSIISELMAPGSLFVNGRTALFINNRTDPLLPSVLNSTAQLLDILEKNHISSPVVIISKFPIPDSLRKFFDTLHLMYVYSFSGYNRDFNYGHLKDDLSTICRNTPSELRYHYHRPIIPGINDDTYTIHSIVQTFEDAHFKGSIVAGIRINKDNVGLLGPGAHFDPQHKLLSSDVFIDLRNSIQNKGSLYQVFRHTSCAISAFMHKPNELKYFDRIGHCSEYCENYLICKDSPSVDYSLVNDFLMAHLPFISNWSYTNNVLVIDDIINQEHIAFIKNALGVSVTANNVKLSASEVLITQAPRH